MRRMLKVVATLVLITMIFTSLSAVGLADTNSIQTITGEIISHQNIQNVLNNYEIEKFSQKNVSIELSIIDVSSDKNQLKIQGNLKYSDGTITNIDLEGSIYNSYYNGRLVADLTDRNKNIEPLFCMVKNSNPDLLTFEKLPAINQFMLYCLDQTGNFIVFECDNQDTAFNTLMYDAGSLKTAPSRSDYLWFTRIADKKHSKSQTNIIQPMTVHQATSTSATATVTSVAGGYTWTEQCYITVTGQIPDVGTAGSALYQTTLKLHEKTLRDGVLFSNDSNFCVQGTSSRPIKCLVGLGNNTMVQHGHWTGQYYVTGQSGVSPYVNLSLGAGFGAFTASYNISYTITDVTSVTRDTDQYYYIEGTQAPKTSSFKSSLTGLNIEDNSDSLSYYGFAATIDSSLTGNVSTSAKFAWTADIRYDSSSEVLVTSFGPTISYIANVK